MNRLRVTGQPHLARSAPSWRARACVVMTVTVAALLVAHLPAGAVPPGWTKPKRVFAASGAPAHSMRVDGAGKVHIAVEHGESGIVYVTNALGSWTQCRVSNGDDRQPSLALGSGVVHVAFARSNAGQQGVYTASGAPVAGPGECGWSVSQRHAGKVSQPSLGAFGDTLHIAFRTADRKLRYTRGPSAADPWDILQTISGKCCTASPSVDITTEGSPRVAYGDGAGSDARGLKFALRGGSKWKKSKVSGGRIKHVSMVLDRSPGVFTPPSSSPKLVYVIKRGGTYHATKPGPGASGQWSYRYLGRRFGPPDVAHVSNRTALIASGGGKIWLTVGSGGIFVGSTISGSGKDGKPQLDLHGIAPVVTFARSKGSPGVYYTRE
ncbi:hypothetical protein BH23CHL8_BH23CHL8_04780 [soil metagenome]